MIREQASVLSLLLVDAINRLYVIFVKFHKLFLASVRRAHEEGMGM